MAVLIQHKRGTAAQWAALNPVLKPGELGFERDTKIIKLGDGVTPWNDLDRPYATPDEVDNLADLLPKGEIAFVELTANSVSASPRTHSGLALSNVPVVSGRIYKVEFTGNTLISGGGTGARIRHEILAGGVVKQAIDTIETETGKATGPFSCIHRFIAVATVNLNFTFKSTLIDGGAPTSVGIVGSATNRPFTSVHDLGAS